MPRWVVQLRVETLENLESVSLAADTRWHLETRCSNCGEEHKDVWCRASEELEVDGSRGSAHVVLKCGLCERTSTLSLEEAPDMAFRRAEHGAEGFASMATFDGRGLEVTAWRPAEGLTAETASGRVFEVALEDGEFYDFDDENDVPVSVAGLEVRVVPEGAAGGGKGGKKKKKGKR
jgi:CXXC motif containing zinc binding protein, eukaryotic